MSGQRYTADGSPIAVYVRSSGRREAELINAQLPSACHVLELGCGAGRLTHELIARGHRITAVDNSPDMLAHVRDADTVLADIIGLDLQRTFDAVVLWSHLINNTDAIVRDELIASCRRHISRDGVVLVLRHEPGWVRTVEAHRNDPVEGITTELLSVEHHDDRLRATVAWELDGERYEQPFEAVDIDDDALHELAAAHDLTITAVLDPNQMLVRLEPVR